MSQGKSAQAKLSRAESTGIDRPALYTLTPDRPPPAACTGIHIFFSVVIVVIIVFSVVVVVVVVIVVAPQTPVDSGRQKRFLSQHWGVVTQCGHRR